MRIKKAQVLSTCALVLYGSSLLDSTYRALSCACSAVDALLGIDLELAVCHGDSANGALSLARTAADTSVTNLICHNNTS